MLLHENFRGGDKMGSAVIFGRNPQLFIVRFIFKMSPNLWLQQEELTGLSSAPQLT